MPKRPGGAGEVTLPQCVAGIGFEGGVEDAGDFRVLVQPARDFEGRGLVLRHAQGERAGAAQDGVGIIGRDIDAEVGGRVLQLAVAASRR